MNPDKSSAMCTPELGLPQWRSAITQCVTVTNCWRSRRRGTGADKASRIVDIAQPAAGDGIGSLGFAACRQLTPAEHPHGSPNNRINH